MAIKPQEPRQHLVSHSLQKLVYFKDKTKNHTLAASSFLRQQINPQKLGSKGMLGVQWILLTGILTIQDGIADKMLLVFFIYAAVCGQMKCP